MPFVTEEVWSWWQEGSVHHAAWPSADELPAGGDAALLADVSAALIGLRGAKSNAKVSMKTPLAAATVVGPRPLSRACASRRPTCAPSAASRRRSRGSRATPSR